MNKRIKEWLISVGIVAALVTIISLAIHFEIVVTIILIVLAITFFIIGVALIHSMLFD